MSLINPEKLKATFKSLETEIQQLLEPPKAPEVPYQVSLDFESDRFQFETTELEEFFILLFSRMANYFERGFLLETHSTESGKSWICPLHFSEGQVYMAEPAIEVEFPIPPSSARRVLRSSPSDWPLKSAEWIRLIPKEKEWTALIFEITPEMRFLFCTKLAEPWLQVQTENAHNYIEKALTVQP